MNRTARFALLWFAVFFVLNTFIGPLVGINDVPVTPGYIIGNIIIWGGAAAIVYFILERKRKKNTKDEKMG
ncbi:hypothetical protein [Flavobacterium album]|uniref:hypothetical protein n=1 Tax=Flavobacterium album TaxID=2175091 RepID=UPI0011B1F813|nr:hypothetical protein [Flavobacterium album]